MPQYVEYKCSNIPHLDRIFPEIWYQHPNRCQSRQIEYICIYIPIYRQIFISRYDIYSIYSRYIYLSFSLSIYLSIQLARIDGLGTCKQPVPYGEQFPQEHSQIPVVAATQAVCIDVVGGSIGICNVTLWNFVFYKQLFYDVYLQIDEFQQSICSIYLQIELQ